MKKRNLFHTIFYGITAAAFMIQLIMPTPVLADGENPPVEPVPTTVPVEPLPTDVPVDPAPVDVPLVADVPAGTDVVVLDENGAVLPLATEAAAEVVAHGDPIWCPSTQAVPTPGLNGCTISYTTLTALLAAEDESLWTNGTIWIEKGVYDGGIGNNVAEVGTTAGGTDYAVRLNGSTNTNSLTIQGGWNSSTNAIDGTSTYILPLNFVWGGNLTIQNITFDGSSATNNPYGGLFVSNTSSGATVTLDQVDVLNVHNADGIAQGAYIGGVAASSLVITDSNFSNNQANGLRVTDFGNITLTRVTASNNASGIGGYGASLECYSGNDCANGTVTIIDSNFNGNGSVDNYPLSTGMGLYVRTNGTINVSGVTANGNTGDGAEIKNGEGTKDLTISNSTFGSTTMLTSLSYPPTPTQRLLAGNGGEGLLVYSKGALTLNSVIADYNRANGLNTYAEGTLTIGQTSPTSPVSSFSHNGMDGILASSAGGAVILSSVLATDNGYHGAELGSGFDTGNYTISGGTFSNNGGQTYHTDSYSYDGLNVRTNGNIILDGVTANGNSHNGAYLNTNNGNVANTGTVTVTNSTFGIATSIFRDGITYDADPRKWGNGLNGLQIVSGGLASLDTVTASYNGSAWQSSGSGIDAVNIAAGGIDLNNVSANYNYANGASLTSANDLDVAGSTFNNNGYFGVYTDGGGNQNFINTNANYNLFSGIYLTAYDNYSLGYGFPNSPTGTVTLSSVTTHDNGLDPNNFMAGIDSTLAGPFTCSGVSSTNNGLADTITCTGGGTSTDTSTGTSVVAETIDGPGFVGSAFIGLPSELIILEDGGQADLACNGASNGIVVKLKVPEHRVFVPCGSLNSAQANSITMTMLDAADLPAAVVDPYTFLQGMEVSFASPLAASMVVSFLIPEGMEFANLAILYWDGSQWVDLGGYQTSDGLFNISSENSGIYVLGSK